MGSEEGKKVTSCGREGHLASIIAWGVRCFSTRQRITDISTFLIVLAA